MQFFTTSRISENIHETPEGFLVCVGVSIARTGEMVYGRGETPIEAGRDGIVVIQRSADEVFSPKTIASFQAKSITIQHPDDFVNPKNWSDLTNGIVQNVRRGTGAEESDLIADLLITSKKGIDLVKAGLREVSCGYHADWEETGVGRGIQRNIVGNHLALVEEGRAGASYAINDHKGKGSVMKLSEKIKAIFAKAQDEAIQAAGEDAPAEAAATVAAGKEMSGYDDLCKAVKDLGSKLDSMGTKPAPKDATTPATPSTPATTVAKDDEVAPGLEERLTKLEAAVSSLLEKMGGAGDDADDVDESDAGDDADDVEVDDEDMDDVEDDAEEGELVGDAASRVEILAPGMKAAGKDVKAKALKAAYATKDGKKVIDQFTAGKAPDFKNAKFVEVLFTAASEILKTSRAKDLSSTRVIDLASVGLADGVMTPEKINEMNAKHYASRSSH